MIEVNGIYFAEAKKKETKKVTKLEDVPTDSYKQFDEFMAAEEEAVKEDKEEKTMDKTTNYADTARQAKRAIDQVKKPFSQRLGENGAKALVKTEKAAKTVAEKSGSAVSGTAKLVSKTATGTTRLAGKAVGGAKKAVTSGAKGSVGFFGSLVGAFKDGYNKGVK
jgi:hypothetical protein